MNLSHKNKTTKFHLKLRRRYKLIHFPFDQKGKKYRMWFCLYAPQIAITGGMYFCHYAHDIMVGMVYVKRHVAMHTPGVVAGSIIFINENLNMYH